MRDELDDVGPDRLEQMFALQQRLQVQTFGFTDFDHMPTHARVDYFKENVLALTDELHEALNETSWKSWAKSDHFNTDKVKGELVDAFHFFMNLCLAAGMTPGELRLLYMRKRAINAQRQRDGYDGVSTKCIGCGRALDDVAVKCVGPNANGERYCDDVGKFITLSVDGSITVVT